MSSFEVIVLGAGDTFSERLHSTALLLCADGAQLAIDCPDMYRGVLRDAADATGRALSLFDIDDVLITHVHGDHMNGLEGVAFFKHFGQDRRLRLHTSPEVRGVIWDRRLAAPMEALWDGSSFRQMAFEDYFDYRPLSWTDVITIGPFEIRARRTIHHVPTSALLVTACGRTLGYSADTAFDPDLIAFLSPADLIIHETNLGPAHTSYRDLLTVDGDVRRKLRLIHYPDTFDIKGSEIAIARQGAILAV
jgi:ribonuclease BN (tRNA processing enzyme)